VGSPRSSSRPRRSGAWYFRGRSVRTSGSAPPEPWGSRRGSPEGVAGDRNAALGGLLALGAVLMFVVGSLLMKRSIATATGPTGLTVQFATASGLLALLAFSPLGSPTLPLTGTVIGSLLWLAAVPSVIGYTIYFYLHHRVGPTQANLVAYVNPTVAVVVGIAIFGEAVTLTEIVGFVLVIVGLLMVHRRGSSGTSSPGPSSAPPRDRTVATASAPPPDR
jgi:drug/metabolite transporter (DMT)-like permease